MNFLSDLNIPNAFVELIWVFILVGLLITSVFTVASLILAKITYELKKIYPNSQFLKRLFTSIMAGLIALDIVICTAWLAPLYVFNLASRPSGRQMISTYVGAAALNGHKWAHRAAAVIDWIVHKLTGQVNHCRASAHRYDAIDD